MNKHFRRVLKMLKPKVKALGFNKKEVEGIAASIADKLDIEEEATEEDIDTVIDTAIDGALPFLKLAQKSASRQFKKYKEALELEDDDDDDEPDDDTPDDEPTPAKGKKHQSKRKPASDSEDDSDEVPAYMKSFFDKIDKRMEKQEQTIAALQGDKISNDRLAQLQGVLKGTGDYGKRVVKAFKRMQFETDDDFDDYLDEVKDDLEKENQSRANEGLKALGPTTTTDDNKKKGNKTEVLTDDQVKALAKGEAI